MVEKWGKKRRIGRIDYSRDRRPTLFIREKVFSEECLFCKTTDSPPLTTLANITLRPAGHSVCALTQHRFLRGA